MRIILEEENGKCIDNYNASVSEIHVIVDDNCCLRYLQGGYTMMPQ